MTSPEPIADEGAAQLVGIPKRNRVGIAAAIFALPAAIEAAF